MERLSWSHGLGALLNGTTWHDQTGEVPPVLDLARATEPGLPPSPVMLAHHGLSSVELTPGMDAAIRASCAIMDDGTLHHHAGSVLAWRFPDGHWGSTTRGAWPLSPSARRPLDALLSAVESLLATQVHEASSVADGPWHGRRLERVVPYNLQRRTQGGGQYLPHFDYEDRELLRTHVRRCAPSLAQREVSVATLWIATESLLTAPLVFYPGGTILDPAPGVLPATIEFGEFAVTDSRASLDRGRALVFDPDRAMHGAVGRVDDDGRSTGTRRSLEIRSLLAWASSS